MSTLIICNSCKNRGGQDKILRYMNILKLHKIDVIHYNGYRFKSVNMQTKRVCATGNGSCHIGVIGVLEI